MPRRPRSVTPSIQFFVVCESIEVDGEGGVSLRRIFDAATPMVVPANIRFAVTIQFRGGTGEHKLWLRIRSPGGMESTTDETSFWLASKAHSHRYDVRITLGIGPEDLGRYELTAFLDGREAMTVPILINPPPTFTLIPPGRTEVG